MQFITKVNNFSRNTIALLGRPALVGTGAAGASYGLARLTGYGFLKHPATLVVTGVVVAAGTETILAVAGRDANVNAEALGANIDSFIKKLAGIPKAERRDVIDAFLKGLPEDMRAGVREGLKAAANKVEKEEKEKEAEKAAVA